MRYRCNDADLSDAVVEAIAERRFAAGMRNFYQRPVFGHAAQDFIEGDNCFRRPYAVFFQRHEFDKAYDDAFLTREHAEGDDLVFVEAAHQDTVDLDRPKLYTLCGADAG